MGPYLCSDAFCAASSGLAAIASFVMWWRSRRDLSLLAIAVGSFIWAAQSMAVVALATSSTIEGARQALTLRTMFGSLGVAAIAWTLAETTGVRARAFVWFSTILMVAVAVAAVAGVPLVGTVTGLEPVSLPVGPGVVRLRAPHRSSSRSRFMRSSSRLMPSRSSAPSGTCDGIEPVVSS